MRDILKWTYELLFKYDYKDSEMPIAVLFLCVFVILIGIIVFLILLTLDEAMGEWQYLSGKLIERKYAAATHHYRETYELFLDSDGLMVKVPVDMQEYYKIKDNSLIAFKRKIGWIWKKQVNVKYLGVS